MSIMTVKDNLTVSSLKQRSKEEALSFAKKDSSFTTQQKPKQSFIEKARKIGFTDEECHNLLLRFGKYL